MSHFRVDDALHSHPKARKAGFEAMGMWTMAGSYCMAYLTDGFVPDWWVKEKPKGVALAKRLVAAGFWYTAEKDGETGWQFHQFVGPGRNDSREQVLADREKWRKKKEGQRGASPPVSPGDNQGDTIRDTQGESPAESLRATRDPTQPNPTEKNSGYEPTKLTLGRPTNRERGTRLPDGWRPPDHVIAQMGSDHPNVNFALENAKFIDYWQAKAGRDARKTDWTATWRNWIRRAAEQAPRSGHTPNGQPHKMRTALELAAELRAEEQTQLETASQRRAIE